MKIKLIRSIAILTMLTFNLCPAGAQVSIDFLLNQRQVLVKQIDTSAKANEIFIRMDFSSSQIKNPEEIKTIGFAAVTKIQLVYTAFQVSDTFNQPSLNKQRLKELQKIFPAAFRNTAIQWEFIGQTVCQNEYDARKLFHGFVIHLRPAATAESSAKEIKLVNNIASSEALGKDTVIEISKMHIRKQQLFVGYRAKIRNKDNSDRLYSSNFMGMRKRSYLVWYDTTISITKVPKFIVDKNALTSIRCYFNSNGIDSTIFKVMERNKQWKDVQFICDVTGSMSPYCTQLLVWHKLNFNARVAKYYSFFNDGDSHPDAKIGNSGGVYHVTAAQVEQVEEAAFSAMKNGWGGANPENNIEALVSAIRKFPDAKEVVMIADNWAPVRDMQLLYLVHKPVHIIVCGSIGAGGINSDLLEIALRTKGSIHTIEEDIVNLYQLNEGKKIAINGGNYLVKGGKFLRI
jgi:hypothetical protein